MGEILRDKEFYAASGGGVTFSGGEPLLQFESLRMLLPECQLNGIHTAVESACNVPVEWLNEVLDNIDLMICDIKAVTPALHKEGTGCTNDRILNNIRHLLTGTDKPVWIRIPVISGFNDNKTEFTGIARFIRSCLEVRGVGGGDSNLERVELLPFHDIGKNKYRALGMEYSYGNSKSPSDGHMMELKQVLRENGVNCVV
jgi:pyruvate formate lyase activating enzyme